MNDDPHALNGSVVTERTKRFSAGDLANAERMVREAEPNILFNTTHGRWLVWDGKRYREDERRYVFEYGRETLSRVLSEGKPNVPANWPLLRNMVTVAESIPTVAATFETFDQDPWILNTVSGTIELAAEPEPSFHPHRASDRLSKLAGARASRDAECPRWEEFVSWAMGDDPAMIAYLQRAVGYCLSGSTREQCLFLNWGAGANGKSTFLNLVSAVLGDYAKSTTFESILQKQNESNHRADLAALVGARFVRASEGDRGRRLSEAVVKVMTGEDEITCRHLYGQFFTYRPQFKLWLASNHRPRIGGQDLGIWRRIHLIPWTQQVTPEMKQKHPDFEHELLEELDGILRWAVHGFIAWRREGLRPPDKVRAATDQYREDMDWIGDFLVQCCELHPDLNVKNAQLYTRYCEWAEGVGEAKRSNKTLSLTLAERGFKKHRTETGIIWLGLTLADKSATPELGF